MDTSHAIRLILAAAYILLGQSALQPAAAQDTVTTGYDAPKAFVRGQELESVLGREVRTRENESGRIIDLLADPNGQVLAGVVELGGFLGIGTRKIAVEWSAFRFDAAGKRSPVLLEMSREQLRLAPEYKPAEPVVIRGKVEE